MSEIPGDTLEDFLAWYYNLVVVGQREANFALAGAEMMGTIPPRPRLSEEQFEKLVVIFEPERESIERMMEDYEPDEQSWRDYAGGIFYSLPEELFERGHRYLQSL